MDEAAKQRIAARIAERKALGLSAADFEAMQEQAAVESDAALRSKFKTWTRQLNAHYKASGSSLRFRNR